MSDTPLLLGEILVRKAKESSPAEYQELERSLLNDGLSRANLDLLIAIGKGDVDHQFFAAGISSSKARRLSKLVQERLLSDELVEVRDYLGAVRRKRWAEMSRSERSRLISPGGKVLAPDQQKVRRRRPNQLRRPMI